MIIKKLTLYNYRAFSGLNEFEFSVKDNKPLNVFEAKNSHGKTTFYRAIHWCLFGGESDIAGESTGIANRGSVRKSQLYAHTTYSVEIEIEKPDGKLIKFKRLEGVQKYQDKPPRSRFLSDKKEYIVKYYDHSRGGYQEKNDEFVFMREVEKIIPEKIAPFCFFDGEKLKSFLADYKNISKKIRAHLELVTHLDSSRQASNNIGRWIDKLLSDSSGNDKLGIELQGYSREITNNRKKEEKLNQEMEDAIQNISELEKDFKVVSNEFKKSQKTKDLARELEGVENDIAICNREIDRLRDKYNRNILDQFDSLILQEPMKNMVNEIEKREEEGKFPPAEIEDTKVIKQLMSDQNLIIPAENNKSKDLIAGKIEWSKNFSKEIFIESIGKFNDKVKATKKGNLVLRANRARIQSEPFLRYNFKSLDKDIQDLAKKIKKEEENLKEYVVTKKKMEKDAIKISPEIYDKILAERSKLNAELMSARTLKDELKGALNTTSEMIAYSTREHSKRRSIYRKKTVNKEKVNFVKLSKSVLDKANDMILEEILVIVNTYFQKYLETILHSKNEFTGRIDHNFNMIVENRDELNVLSPEHREEASEGQRNIIAYAYMLAINKAAGLSFPIMIDTPAGRLDSEHKINTYQSLIDTFNSTKNLNQLIMLVQDSELNVAPEFSDVIRKKIIPKFTSTYFKITKNDETKNSSAEKVI